MDIFNWPYFDLSQIWSLSFLLEAPWLADIWHGIWGSFFIDGSQLALEYLCWPFTWVAIIILFVFACAATALFWFPLWGIWYLGWKLFICLVIGTFWNFIIAVVLPVVIWFLKVFGLPVMAGLFFAEIHQSKDWRWQLAFFVLYPSYYALLFVIFPFGWAVWFYFFTIWSFFLFAVQVVSEMAAKKNQESK